MKSGELVAIGVVQEQHPDRAGLYKQWRKLDWPIFVDSLNLLGHRAVPIPVGINESGLVVYERMRSAEELQGFLNKDFERLDLPRVAPEPRHAGDDLFLAGKLDEAIEAYRGDAQKDRRARFRLGVALQRRHESANRQPGDGQWAVNALTVALLHDPGQYIWRRRIQQYGPRLDKPYNFYGWVEQARKEIRARGEEPVPLAVEPRGAEVLGPQAAGQAPEAEPDPEGKISRDDADLVGIETIVTPMFVQPGRRVRVRMVFRVKGAFWNNEADPLVMHVATKGGIAVAEGVFRHSNAAEPETQEARILECELQVAERVPVGKHTLSGYALYSVCEDKGGVCRYLRRDFEFEVVVDR